MALVKCKECGNEVSTEAKACPKCGASIAIILAKSADWWTPTLVVVVVLILIALCSPKDSNVPERHLTAVASRGDQFVIRNNDTFAWGNCDLELNDDYKIKGVNIEASENFSVKARDFTKKDGTRFNPFTTKSQTLFIYCRQTPHGTLSTLLGWK